MAAWQYSFHMLPASCAREGRSTFAVDEETGLIDTGQCWVGFEDVKGLVQAISGLLPAMSSWNSAMSLWGTLEGNRIDVVSTDDFIDSVHVRIDVRNISADFLRDVVIVAERYKLLFLMMDMAMIEPSVDNLLKYIKVSDAFRFVKDPRAFLETLRQRTS